MGTDFNLPFSEILGEGPVPTVDPVDLRNVWEMGRQMKNQLQPGLQSSSGVVIGAEFYERHAAPARMSARYGTEFHKSAFCRC